MKKIITLFLIVQSAIFNIQFTVAQAPDKMSYQTVIRNATGNLVMNQVVGIKISILQGSISGTAQYVETQTPTTNSNGLASIQIGNGNIVSGSIAGINWGTGPFFLKTETDPTGGTNYTISGVSQLLSVAYALNAKTAINADTAVTSLDNKWNASGNNISNSNSGNVGIGTAAPVNSAKLDVTSTTQGFLPPRMTNAERNAISNPAAGLVIWSIDCNELQVYNGTIWKNMIGVAACAVPIPPLVKMCNQEWMNENLELTNYRNGDPIPKVTDSIAWGALTTGAYCYYNNDSATYSATYGKLYNWYAVVDPRGLCPAGWHVPSDSEWTVLENCLGGSIAGGKMKETGTTHWLTPNTGANNSSGFTGLPGGTRYNDGKYNLFSNYGFWWSSTQNLPIDAWFRFLVYNNGVITRASFAKPDGFSVRCVKD